MSNSEDYTIGWICAIKTEYVAAQVFLDEKHDRPETVSPNDNNDYTLGKIGKHNVVIAVLPSGEYGISSAAVVARDMLSSFPNVRIGLMVGIGGGVPNQKHDIRLGDVVVSAPSDGGAGVIQYNMWDTIQGQGFKITGFLNQSPTVLRTAVHGLQAQHEIEGHQLEDAINNVLERYPRLKKSYGRQRQDTDRLYQPEVVHPLGFEGSCDITCGSDSASLVLRRQRAEDEDNPAIHYGRIASASNLMKDALLRDALAEERDVLCFEMEAAGLTNHFPCLVIRGICDYADSHKNKEWQGYAAMAAAAYTKALLNRITPSKVEEEKKISDILPGVILHTLSPAIEDVKKIKSKLDGDKQIEILNWLTTTNYGSQHSDYIRRRQQGTGQWLLTSPIYKAWCDGDKQILFCHGIPGAGKTILASIVIEDLTKTFQHDPDVGIAFIYCNFRSQDQQKDDDLLRSLLKQLSEQRQALPECVKDLFDHHKPKHTRPPSEDIFRDLQSVAAMYSRVFIIVDALDECQENDGSRRRFLTQISNLQTKCRVSFLATSRRIPHIMDNFKEETQLEVRATKEDLRNYLENRISLLPRCVQLDPQLIEEVKAAILQTVDGMFLLAQLHLESLRGETTPKAIREALKRLPTGSEAYDKAYVEAMIRIESQAYPQHRKLAKQAIAWISCAKRPLTSSELEHALAVNSGDSEFDRENISRVEDVVTFCAGLVTVDEESGITRLVHYTTQEFFQRTKTRWFPNIEAEITNVCATYLSFRTFESGHCRSYREFEERKKNFRLYEYASIYWGIHAREGDISSRELITFLQKKSQIQASVQTLFAHHYYWSVEDFPKNMTVLHLIAYFGLEHVARKFLLNATTNPEDNAGRTPLSWEAQKCQEEIATVLLDTEKVNVDLKDSTSRTPLSWASENGHEAIVKLLLGTGKVDVDSKDSKYNKTPLSWAVEYGHEAIVKLLLDTGKVDVDSQDCTSRTPLSWAAEYGHEAVVKLLLDTGKVDVDSKDYAYNQTPLSWAAENGHEAIVKLLLGTGKVDADSKDSTSRTPLFWASENGHEAIVKLLLGTGKVDVDSNESKYNQTPLSWAAGNGHEAIVKLLLDTGKVDVDSKDSRYNQTLLSWAARNGHKEIVKLLLDTGKVDVNSKDSKYNKTPLLWAAQRGHEAIVKLLLDTGKVDVNSKDSQYNQTPLSWAAKYGHEAIVKLLLDTGKVDVDSNDSKYNQTPLSWAAEYGHEAIVNLLLDTGKVDADSKDSTSRTPLSWAAEYGHEAIVKLLLDTGKVDVNSKDSQYNRTPLSWAAEYGYEAIVRLLLDTENVDVDSKDSISQTPLLWAGVKGDTAIVSLLLDTGKVDVDLKDSASRTPLSWAAENGHEAIVKLLLDTGKVDADSKDSTSRTPLSWAAKNGHEATVMLLLDTGKVDVDSKDSEHNRTPLSWAAQKVHEAIVKLLLDTGKIDADSKDSASRTPLSWASENGHEAIVKLLLGTGKVDVDSKDSTSRTPLSWAAENGHEGIVTLLLGTGKVDVDSKDSTSRTPLSWASKNGHEAIVKLLLGTGKVDVDSNDSKYNQTPLSWAAENGHEAIVKLLLDTGKVDVDSKDSTSRTPLSWASENGHEAVVKLLLDTGMVDVDSKDYVYNQTPLSWAAENGHEAIVKMLLGTGKGNVDSKDSTRRNPLLWAKENGHESIVKLLLDTGSVDVDLENCQYKRTPLLWAAYYRHDKIINLCHNSEKSHVALNRDEYYRTPHILVGLRCSYRPLLSWVRKNGRHEPIKRQPHIVDEVD